MIIAYRNIHTVELRQCIADSESYLKYEHFCTKIDLFLFYFLWSCGLLVNISPLSIILNRNIQRNLGLHFIAYLAFFICKKWKQFFDPKCSSLGTCLELTVGLFVHLLL